MLRAAAFTAISESAHALRNQPMLFHFVWMVSTALARDGCPFGSTTIATTLFFGLVRQHIKRFAFFSGSGDELKRNV